MDSPRAIALCKAVAREYIAAISLCTEHEMCQEAMVNIKVWESYMDDLRLDRFLDFGTQVITITLLGRASVEIRHPELGVSVLVAATFFNEGLDRPDAAARKERLHAVFTRDTFTFCDRIGGWLFNHLDAWAITFAAGALALMWVDGKIGYGPRCFNDDGTLVDITSLPYHDPAEKEQFERLLGDVKGVDQL